MPRTITISIPDREREEYLAAEPLCEHSLEVGKSIMLHRMARYGAEQTTLYRAIPRWRVFTRYWFKVRLAAQLRMAIAVTDDDNYEEGA